MRSEKMQNFDDALDDADDVLLPVDGCTAILLRIDVLMLLESDETALSATDISKQTFSNRVLLHMHKHS